MITSAIRRGRLAVTVDADAGAYTAATAEQLLTTLLAEITRMLRDLAAATPRAPRPDDFAHVALDAEELDDLLEDLS